MSEAAKLREMMKDKAKRLATADPSKKVDASSWTPPEPLNADIKTGMRPLSRRAYKKGGKVVGEVKGGVNAARADRKARKDGGKTDDMKEATAFANAKVNRNLKDANQLREGKKHVGGFKRGGNPKGAEADPDMLNKITTEEYRRNLEKRQSTSGGEPQASDLYDKQQLERLERGYKKGGRSNKNVGGVLKALSPVAMLAGLAEDDDKKCYGGRAKKQAGGMLNDPRTAGNAILQNSAMASGVPQDLLAFAPSMPSQGVKKFLGLKTGGKAKHPDEAMDKALIEKMVKKGALTAKAKGGMALDGTLQGTRPTGGRKAYKKGGAAKGKTDINIVIATGKPQGAMDAPMPPMPPPGGPAPMMRKAGGKVYRSYKDMDAGAGSGLGRLEKTEIAKRTAHKAGGKVYRSYKDMDAGAGSGLGRLEKTEIQSHKRGS